MHYYKKNLGEYAKKAGRLSIIQHGVYNLLIDACYDRETFPTMEEAIDWVWASSKEEIEAVEFVLKKFFKLEDGLYIQNRIEEELNKYHENATKNKRIAIERETNRKEKSTKRARSVHEPSPKQEPLTINHKPITNKKTKALSANADQIAEVFDYWIDVMGKNKKTSKLTDKRSKAIKSRLTEGYELETIKLAIDECKADDWSMGENDRNKAFNDIELICRTGEKLEHFADGGAQIDTDTSYLNEPSVFDMPDDLNVINGVFKNA